MSTEHLTLLATLRDLVGQLGGPGVPFEEVWRDLMLHPEGSRLWARLRRAGLSEEEIESAVFRAPARSDA
jgi:hypothetical protein